MKKKVIALALSALMVTGLVGCGNNDKSSKTNDGALKVEWLLIQVLLMINHLIKVRGKELKKLKRVLGLKQLYAT